MISSNVNTAWCIGMEVPKSVETKKHPCAKAGNEQLY